MGLTAKTSGINLLQKKFNIEKNDDKPVIALAGNPNTGKSTVFNNLTGLRQHTGNWPGKTVTQAQGFFNYKDQELMVIDLPGTYSLLSNSTEERIARDFICFAKPNATIVIADATNLERNLNLVLQVMELTDKVILCVNLMDEAQRKNIKIDIKNLKKELQIPIIPTVAKDGKGLNKLKKVTYQISNNLIKIEPAKINYSKEIEKAVEKIIPVLEKNIDTISHKINLRWLALRLLEGDQSILKSVEKYFFKFKSPLKKVQKEEVQADGII